LKTVSFLSIFTILVSSISPPPQAADREYAFSDSVNWAPAFYPQGLSGTVLSLLVEGDSVYAAGQVGLADSIGTWGLALWDGRKWTSPLKKPPFKMRWISQVFRENGKMHFGGDYSDETQDTRFLASWNGQAWETRDLPVPDIVLSMTAWQGKLVLATFMEGLWQAEDTQVTAFQPQVKGIIQGVTVQGGRLWVRGRLAVPGDTSTHGVAYLENGAWKVPGPLQSRVGLDWAWLGDEAFVLDGNAVFAPSLDPTALLRWNGSGWSRVSVDPSAGLLRLLASDGKDLYLIGTDRVAMNTHGIVEEGLRISKWDGQKFTLVDRQAFQGQISQAKAVNGGLILGGAFQGIGDVRADNLARWDGNRWTPYTLQLRPGLAVPGSAAISWGDKLIVAGDGIRMAGTIPVANIAAWGEAGWSALGSGIRREKFSAAHGIPALGVDIASLAAQNGKLYAAGGFDTAGNRYARNIAEWDGSEWSPMGDGLPFEAVKVLANGADVYAIGDGRDTLQGGRRQRVCDVAGWNGSAWHSLGILPAGDYGNDMAIFDGALWAGSDDSLVKWNGTGWEGLDLGLKAISSLLVHQNALFLSANISKLYKYAGGKLDTLPSVAYAEEFASDGENLFVYGEFDFRGSANTNLARWTGKEWIPMAELSVNLGHMLVHGDYLYLILERQGYPTSGFHYYLRWSRKTGTWSQSGKMGSRPGKDTWKAIPCFRDCILRGRIGNGGWFDVRGRKLPAASGSASAAGVKILSSKKAGRQ
jgi:hypothetical protein